ncbi:Cytochrome b561 and DOMON domain-containing protein [Vigna angularis]|uniref:Cytochrome b561 and DOMON domain-containing protein n=1 Tax=Phaseolus angularis TaxID=3914 RepID=A0A8T0JHX1_PHAAN|nr:Cytochrome b561 and DOMON domain-containing protein [Vigna angularis]
MSFFSSSTPDSNLATAKAALSMAALMAATTMVIRSVVSEILPPEFMLYVRDGLHSALKKEAFLLRSSPLTKDTTTTEPAKRRIGMKLGSESEGVQYSVHRNLGIALFCFATL